MGAGGIVRNNQGDFIFAFTAFLGAGTNNQAEMEVASIGHSWCLQLGYKRVILEVDSELVVRWINQPRSTPRKIQAALTKVQKLINKFQEFKGIHTLEGSQQYS